MSQAPVMPLYCDAYLADTMHLSLEEHGAYLKLLLITWRANGVPIQDDDARIARMLGVSVARWRAKIRPVLEPFFDLSNGTWLQHRLQREWDQTQARIEKNRHAGAMGGKARHEKSPKLNQKLVNLLEENDEAVCNENDQATEPKILKTNERAQAVASPTLKQNASENQAIHIHIHKEDIGGGGGVARAHTHEAAPNRSVTEPKKSSTDWTADERSLVDHFERLRCECWPNEASLTAPKLTLLTQARDVLTNQGVPLELAVEVVERGMRASARQGRSATGSLRAFHRSMADAIATHTQANPGGPPNDRHAHERRRSSAAEGLADRERRDREAIMRALSRELEPG